LTTTQRDAQELELMRRELTRLRNLVEEIHCNTPESIPAPVPDIPSED
jgi:hypothetical protein